MKKELDTVKLSSKEMQEITLNQHKIQLEQIESSHRTEKDEMERRIAAYSQEKKGLEGRVKGKRMFERSVKNYS